MIPANEFVPQTNLIDLNGPIPRSILQSNYVPSPSERDIVKSFISLHQERSLSLDAEVRRAEDALHELHLEQQVQHELLATHQALLTPMRRLIPDVLREIFRHCHDDAQDAPMRLVSVCKKWREIVLATPTLWSNIQVRGTFPCDRIVPYVKACAKHSDACGLRIIITFMHSYHRSRNMRRRALAEALQILAEHAHRWRSFEMLTEKSYYPHGGFAEVSAPQLEKLVWSIDDVHVRLPFSSLPNLREFRPASLHPLDVPLVLQCIHLRKIVIGGISGELTLADCWTIFSNCLFLEKFDVSAIKQSGDDLTQRGVVTLPYLHELRIGPSVPDPAPLIHRIRTPAMAHLRLLVGKSLNFDSSCIERLILDCRPPLRSLSLVNTNCADVAACLPLLPYLKSLLLQQSAAVDLVILRLLERDDAGRYVCPELEHLGLRLCIFAGTRLLSLAKARKVATGGLRVLSGNKPHHNAKKMEWLSVFTIELNLVGEFTDEELEELHDLKTIGNNVDDATPDAESV